MVCRFWDTFYLISIHALREESDQFQTRIPSVTQDFNPRSP